MTIHDFSRENSILNQFICEIRDENFQKNKALFRNNIARIGEILSYELSKTLSYKSVSVTTPLGIKKMQVPADQIVLCSVMRA
jgi:uracil phosphoribosyltransferase